MTTTVTLRTTAAGAIVASHNDRPFGEPTPADQLPQLGALQANPFELGRQLTAALGGDELLELLAADSDRLLLLDCDERADQIAWEFASTHDRQFLAVRFGLLRQLDGDAPPTAPPPAPQPQVHFIALAADPLVDEQGQPRGGYRLALDTEMKAIRRVLADSGVALQASRIPPTKEALRKALLRGPALLRLSCHGNVVDTEHGEMAVLLLEDNDGGEARLLGRDLTAMAPPGMLRMVLLSACQTAAGDEARLARALVRQGVPLAIGMQGNFSDPLSDDLAESLYATLLAGHTTADLRTRLRQRFAFNRRCDRKSHAASATRNNPRSTRAMPPMALG